MNRRKFLGTAAALGVGALASENSSAQSTIPAAAPASGSRATLTCVSTYSYWRYQASSKVTIEASIRMAAEMGFDAVEVLEIQMERKDNAYLQSLKRQALAAGLHLAGLSAHQSFVSPKPEERKANIATTIASIELAYALGISAMRVNTGRWGTSKNFDELMKNRGIEPPLPGFKDEDAFPWVIEALEKCLPGRRVRRGAGTRKSLGPGTHARRTHAHHQCGPLAMAGCKPGHRQFSGRPLRQAGIDSPARHLGARQVLLGRRHLVHAGFGLPAYRRHPPQSQLPRLHLPGVRRQRGRRHRRTQKSGRAAQGILLVIMRRVSR